MSTMSRVIQNAPEPYLRRLSSLADEHVLGLLDDAREALAHAGSDALGEYESALASLELEAASRDLIRIGPVCAHQAVIRHRLQRAIERGDARMIGTLAGELEPASLIAAFEDGSAVPDANRRFLGLAAICVTLEARLSGWEEARVNAAGYMDDAVPVADRLLRLERRWGYLLGLIDARLSA